jgi:DNA-binding transcriptional LysR family regulator
VSQQLGTLEKETGVRLLEPAGRRVRLTAQANLIVAHTEVLLAEMERAEAALAQFMARSDESCMPCHGPRCRITLAV